MNRASPSRLESDMANERKFELTYADGRRWASRRERILRRNEGWTAVSLLVLLSFVTAGLAIGAILVAGKYKEHHVRRIAPVIVQQALEKEVASRIVERVQLILDPELEKVQSAAVNRILAEGAKVGTKVGAKKVTQIAVERSIETTVQREIQALAGAVTRQMTRELSEKIAKELMTKGLQETINKTTHGAVEQTVRRALREITSKLSVRILSRLVVPLVIAFIVYDVHEVWTILASVDEELLLIEENIRREVKAILDSPGVQADIDEAMNSALGIDKDEPVTEERMRRVLLEELTTLNSSE